MEKVKYLLLLFMFALCINLVNAQPPAFVSSNPLGFNIEQPNQIIYKYGEPIKINLHVFNSSNGVPITNNTTCSLQLYNYKGDELLTAFAATPSGHLDYEFNIPTSNITYSGTYNYHAQCNSTSQGGYVSAILIINAQGKEYGAAEGLVYIGIFIILIALFAFFLYGSITIPFKNPTNSFDEVTHMDYKKQVKIFCIAMAYLVFSGIVYVAWNISAGILEFTEIANFFYVFFRITLVGLMIMPIAWFVFAIIFFFKDNKLYQMLQRGLTVKEK